MKSQEDRLFGCHVSVAGGLHQAVLNAVELQVNAIQLHPSQPQRWMYKPFAKGIEDEFVAARAASPLKSIFFHGLYLINLASTDEELQAKSRTSLVYYLDLIDRVGGNGVIFHVGSNKDQPSEESGFAQAATIINQVLEAAPRGRLLLEVAAGSGAIIGDQVDELAAIYAQVEQKERVGFALDTQHMWASGYDLRGNLDWVIAEVARAFTFDKVWAIHLNDSKTECASRKDRHENLGQGLIGREAITAFVHRPELRHIPLILETPGLKDLESAKLEVAALQSVLNQR